MFVATFKKTITLTEQDRCEVEIMLTFLLNYI